MNHIKITKENIDKEHICCAMSGKQSVTKKEWMKERFGAGGQVAIKRTAKRKATKKRGALCKVLPFLYNENHR